ncbi:acyltransferase [Parvularcula sp. ZS-1/3]|uniref:Acyltransferase n=1 Tax=Parvularcula mediterranea TaxID=2732508 RepID=A0A7Y3W528_9PROT|nr:lysophospholipid acyltransferase family protein [Parvularcula mediterranea]NNU15862.1 acyltransferase [Parvularcula mediterranea]
MDDKTPIEIDHTMLGSDAKPLSPEGSEADREIYEWQSTSPYYVRPPTDTGHLTRHQHIVDQLIRERAIKLSQSTFWPLYRLTLNGVLDYGKAKRMVDEAGRMDAKEAFGYASRMIQMKLEVDGIENIPKDGPCIIACNHPTGIADGLALHDVITEVRPDPIVFVNADAIRLNPRLTDKLIPVEWRDDKKSRAKSRETLKATKKAFDQGRSIILFPSGRLAYMNDDKELIERPWMSTVANLPKRYKCPVIPVNLKSRNSWLYYWFNNIDEELRNMTLFHELMNKKGQTFDFKIGKPIQPEELLDDDQEAADELQKYVCEGVREGLSLEEWRAQRDAD